MVIFGKSFYINILIHEKRIQSFKTVKRKRQDTAASIPLATGMKSIRLLAFLIVCTMVAAIYNDNIVDKNPEEKNKWISVSSIKAVAITGISRIIFRRNSKTDRGKIDNLGTDSIIKRMMKHNGLQSLKPNSLFTTYKIQNQQSEEKKTTTMERIKKHIHLLKRCLLFLTSSVRVNKQALQGGKARRPHDVNLFV